MIAFPDDPHRKLELETWPGIESDPAYDDELTSLFRMGYWFSELYCHGFLHSTINVETLWPISKIFSALYIIYILYIKPQKFSTWSISNLSLYIFCFFSFFLLHSLKVEQVEKIVMSIYLIEYIYYIYTLLIYSCKNFFESQNSYRNTLCLNMFN